jgi:hypothetical protein
LSADKVAQWKYDGFLSPEALSFRGKPRQLSHVSHAVEDSVNRAGQVITEPLEGRRKWLRTSGR